MTLFELCWILTETKNSNIYALVDGLIRLISTISILTTNTKQVFSTMKLVKPDFMTR